MGTPTTTDSAAWRSDAATACRRRRDCGNRCGRHAEQLLQRLALAGGTLWRRLAANQDLVIFPAISAMKLKERHGERSLPLSFRLNRQAD